MYNNANNHARIKSVILANLFLLTICLLVPSCTQHKKYKYFSADEIVETVSQLDSSVKAIKGFEPNDENYIELPDSLSPSQESYDSARVVWNHFVKLCSNREFGKAYRFYKEPGTYGHLIVALKHSDLRYPFFIDVLWPLMMEYETDENPVAKLVDILKLEYYMESYSMAVDIENHYVPSSFPDLVHNLGTLLATLGRMEEALDDEMVKQYTYAVYMQTQNPAYANFSLTILFADIYCAAEDYKSAVDVLENYKAYTKENLDPDRDCVEYEEYMQLVDKKISDIQDKA